jgi:hypothetical protein
MGKILNCQVDAKAWAYAVDMEMGPLPDMGRVGPKATIWLYEAEIEDVSIDNGQWGKESKKSG